MATKTLNVKGLQLRGDTAANWTRVDPVLAVNEMGIERDTRKFKFGDGISKWSELEYGGSTDIEIDTALSATSENPVQNKVVNEAVHYTNDTATLSALGGIKAGTTFNNVPVTQMLTDLLYPYTKPTISISVSPNGGTKEKGTSVSITSLKVTPTRKSSDLAKVEVKQGSTVIKTVTSGITSGTAIDCLPSSGITVTSNTSFSATVTDVDGGTGSASGGSFSFVDPYFYGVVESDATINSATVLGLTKKVEAKGSKTFTYTTSGQKMAVAYPASYGNLKSAIDPNGFDLIGTFTKKEVTVSVQSGSVLYYVYVETEPSTVSGYAVKFNY